MYNSKFHSTRDQSLLHLFYKVLIIIIFVFKHYDLPICVLKFAKIKSNYSSNSINEDTKVEF